MNLWHLRARRSSDQPSTDEKPDINKAQAKLARIRSQRPAVDELVASLIVERRLNNFSANLTATFRGGRP